MKRYLLFVGNMHNPFGGWKDFVGEFDTKDDVYATLSMNPTYDSIEDVLYQGWYQIVDTVVGAIIKEVVHRDPRVDY